MKAISITHYLFVACLLLHYSVQAGQDFISTAGYQLTLPDDWRLATDQEFKNLAGGNPNPSITIDLIALTGIESEGHTPKITVLVVPDRVIVDQPSLASFEQVLRNKYSTAGNQLKQIFSTIETIGDTQCMKFVVDVEMGQRLYTFMQYMIPADGRMLFVICFTHTSYMEIHGPQFDEMMQTFHLKAHESGDANALPSPSESHASTTRAISRDDFELDLAEGWVEFSEDEYLALRAGLNSVSGIDSMSMVGVYFDESARNTERMYARLDIHAIDNAVPLTEQDRIEFEKGLVSSYTTRGAAIKVISSEIGTFGNYQGIRLVTVAPLNNYRVINEKYVYPVDGKSYVFTFRCLESRHAEYKPHFEQMLSSLKLPGYSQPQLPVNSGDASPYSLVIIGTVVIAAVSILLVLLAIVYVVARRPGLGS